MHTEKLKAHRKNEDPRLSFTTPEFKEASRVFTEAYKARTVAREGRTQRASRAHGAPSPNRRERSLLFALTRLARAPEKLQQARRVGHGQALPGPRARVVCLAGSSLTPAASLRSGRRPS